MDPVHLFVYGTLMYPAVYRSITGHHPVYQRGKLNGFEPRVLIDRTYPGLVSSDRGYTTGRLIRGLDRRTLDLLDRYEGDEYRLIRVSIETSNGYATAFSYALDREHLKLATSVIWRPDAAQL